MFKEEKATKFILCDIGIYFNNALSSKRAFQRPFIFSHPLNFSTKESHEILVVSFDADMVQKVIKV